MEYIYSRINEAFYNTEETKAELPNVEKDQAEPQNVKEVCIGKGSFGTVWKCWINENRRY